MNDDFFLRNRTTTAIITGGAQGLGFAIAERPAREGAYGIILSGRSVDKGEKAAASIQSRGTDCLFVAREHRQYPLHGGALRTILFVGLLSVERSACYAHEILSIEGPKDCYAEV
jgi:NAD(P)-dependent dehydrogenase (short-subunit alcohol dehydrogenase family)